MRTLAAIAVCIVLGLTCTRLATAGDQPPAGSAAGAQVAATHGDELHFVSVLTLHGEVVSVDPANRLVTLKGPKGETSTLEARSEKNLAAVKVGDRVAIRYFEGVQIRKKKPGEAVPVPSLKDGIIGAKLGRTSKTKHAIIASVEAIDQADQEVTLKGPDGSLETIMVTDPEYLERIEVGDQVVLTRSQALALSIDKED
jgi:co-chaperonin GroES (HSP10)